MTDAGVEDDWFGMGWLILYFQGMGLRMTDSGVWVRVFERLRESVWETWVYELRDWVRECLNWERVFKSVRLIYCADFESYKLDFYVAPRGNFVLLRVSEKHWTRVLIKSRVLKTRDASFTHTFKIGQLTKLLEYYCYLEKVFHYNYLFPGYIIPKGWKVLVWYGAVHMDSEIYDNPQNFDPSRWNVSPFFVLFPWP